MLSTMKENMLSRSDFPGRDSLLVIGSSLRFIHAPVSGRRGSRLKQRTSKSQVVRASAFEATPRGIIAPLKVSTPQWVLTQREHSKAVAKWLVENERLLVVAGSTMICSLSHTALRPVLPIFSKGFGVGAAAVGTTISVYAFARLIMNVPAGIMGDQHGRKPLLVWGPAVTALGMIGCGLAGTFQQLLFWRFVTGMGSALQMAGAQLFLGDISKSSNRARVLGTNQAASLMGGLMGPAVGGILADTVGIRAPFTFTGAAAMLAALYGLLRLPETRSKETAAAEAESPAAAEVPSEVGVVRNNAVPANLSASVKGRVPVEAVVGGGAPDQLPSRAQADELRRYESSTATTSTPAVTEPQPSPRANTNTGSGKTGVRSALRQLMACRNFRAIALVNAVMFATANGSRAVLMPLLAVQGFGMKTTYLGFIFAGMAVISLVGVMPAAHVADSLGRKWTIMPSCLGLAAALCIMAMTGRIEGFLAAAAIWAVSNACIGATPAAYAADVMPKNVSGLGLGIYRCAGDMGLMMGPALLGFISDKTSVQTAMVSNALVLLVVVTIFGLTADETRDDPGKSLTLQPKGLVPA